MENIGSRLKALREKLNLQMRIIAEETNIPIHNLYKWEAGHKPSNTYYYNKLVAYLDAMENKTADESSPVYIIQPPATMRLPLDPNATITGQTSGKAAAGTIVVNDDKPELIVDRIDAPFLGEIEGVVEVSGESMVPTFINGCRIAITRLTKSDLIIWGECYYIVDINFQGVVRRVYFESVESIRLVSDYKDQDKYPPFTRRWEDIIAIFSIKATIQKC